MPVQHHRITADCLAKAAHRQPLNAIRINYLECISQDGRAGDWAALLVLLVGVRGLADLPGI
jgi:hypothetical protein